MSKNDDSHQQFPSGSRLRPGKMSSEETIAKLGVGLPLGSTQTGKPDRVRGIKENPAAVKAAMEMSERTRAQAYGETNSHVDGSGEVTPQYGQAPHHGVVNNPAVMEASKKRWAKSNYTEDKF